jgi:predicted ester cyclase
MAFVRAFPDIRITVRNQVAGDDWVAFESHYEGMHEGALEGPGGAIPATNRHVTGTGAEFIRIEDGKVVEERLYFDQLEFLTQLGVIPQPATA